MLLNKQLPIKWATRFTGLHHLMNLLMSQLYLPVSEVHPVNNKSKRWALQNTYSYNTWNTYTGRIHDFQAVTLVM